MDVIQQWWACFSPEKENRFSRIFLSTQTFINGANLLAQPPNFGQKIYLQIFVIGLLFDQGREPRDKNYKLKTLLNRGANDPGQPSRTGSVRIATLFPTRGNNYVNDSKIQ